MQQWITERPAADLSVDSLAARAGLSPRQFARTFAAERPGLVRDSTGALRLLADVPLSDVPHPDIVLVPGSPGQAEQMAGGPVHAWLRAASEASSWTTSVCTGSLILAATGLLAGRRATTRWLAMDELRAFGVTTVSERVVIDGKLITAAGVSAGIDMALSLAGRIGGTGLAQAIQLGIEYDPRPPYAADSPATAPPDLVATVRARGRRVTAGG